ncbi:flagellar FliJ family protein [bacterium]|nr:flagellar FliJ family protein [bacterium]
MKKFKFRLERVQRLRERTREQRKLQLAEAINFRMQIEGQKEQLTELRSNEQDLLRSELSKPEVVVEDAIRARVFDGLLARHAARVNEQLKQIEGVVEQRRQQLMEAEKSVRIIEKLGDKVRQRYNAVLDHADRQLMDELALLADQRRRFESNV